MAAPLDLSQTYTTNTWKTKGDKLDFMKKKSICETLIFVCLFVPSLVGHPLHKRGRVWSTLHHEFVLQTQQWASSTRL